VNWIAHLVFSRSNPTSIWRRLVPTPASAVVCPGFSFGPLGNPTRSSVGAASWISQLGMAGTIRCNNELGDLELFIPRLAVGTVYKYEVRRPEGTAYPESRPLWFFSHEIRAPNGPSVCPSSGNFRWKRSRPGLNQRTAVIHSINR